MVLALLALLAAVPARCDSVTLTNGDAVTGIITKEYAAGLDLQVDEEGFITLSSSTVAAVKRQSAQENKALAAGWRSSRKEQEKKKSDAERFALEQRLKGLVLYHGEWMRPEEARQHLAEKQLDLAYSPAHAQAFITHEAEPLPFRAPGVSNENIPRSYQYYYFSSAPRRARIVTFKDGKIISSR